jgi:hypothetical protein
MQAVEQPSIVRPALKQRIRRVIERSSNAVRQGGCQAANFIRRLYSAKATASARSVFDRRKLSAKRLAAFG